MPDVHKLNVFAMAHVTLQPKLKKLCSQKIFEKLKPKAEVLKNVTPFSGCTAEIHR